MIDIDSSDQVDVNGRCPYEECDHFFVGADMEQVGDHFREHGPKNMPTELAAQACLQLMNFRRKQYA